MNLLIDAAVKDFIATTHEPTPINSQKTAPNDQTAGIIIFLESIVIFMVKSTHEMQTRNGWSQARQRCSASDATTSGESRPFRAGCAVGGKRLRG